MNRVAERVARRTSRAASGSSGAAASALRTPGRRVRVMHAVWLALLALLARAAAQDLVIGQ